MQAVYDADAASPQLPHSPRNTYRQSQLLPSEPLTSRSLLGSRSAAALDRLVKPSVHVAEAVAPRQRAGWAQRISAATRLGFSAVERVTGFSRGQTSLGLQMAVAWIASMFLVIIPSVYEALVSGWVDLGGLNGLAGGYMGAGAGAGQLMCSDRAEG
jgi:hypothetical protein